MSDETQTEYTPAEQKSLMLREERGEIQLDQVHIAELEAELAKRSLPPELMARLTAVFQLVFMELEEIHKHPPGVSRARLLGPIRNWRAKRTTIEHNLGRRR